MNKKEIIDSYTFEYNLENEVYECRGDVCYDDEHDEMLEEGLWNAACKLKQKLKNQNIDSEVEYSEKGWVEVYILN